MTRFVQGGDDGQISGHQERYEKEAQQNRKGKEEGKAGKEERKITAFAAVKARPAEVGHESERRFSDGRRSKV